MPFPRFYGLPVVSVLGAMLMSGCGSLDIHLHCENGDTFCVGLVTDAGGIDDNAFNTSAWAGVRQSEAALNAWTAYLESTDSGEFDVNIGRFAADGFDVVVSAGYALNEATVTAAGNYPDTDFIGVDQSNDGSLPNLTSLVFREDQAGFLAGALAAMMSKSGTVAAVLATNQAPGVVAFKEGYEVGAKYIDPNVTVISTYHPGGVETAFTDPEWGAAAARDAIESGADVLFGVGGTTGNGAIIETAAHEGAYCIGVDSDQWYSLPEAHPCLISSAMKMIAPGVFDLIEAAKEGTFPRGTYYGEIGIAPYHDFDALIPESVKTKIEELEQNLADGTISTGYTP